MKTMLVSVYRLFANLFWLIVLCLGAIIMLTSVVHAQGTIFIPGQFSVGSSGVASYSIPIEVPPGTAGLVPKLSLEYSSQSGDGLLGVGWQLGGFSVITRCSRTQAQDGVRGRVNFDLNDRFCLDGKRLVAVTGSYGANGTEYRTEREEFAKIVSYGTAGNGPSWFKVWTKSGQIMEFGNTTDSRILQPGNTTPFTWALNRVSDIKGNYYTASYVQSSGAYWPTRMDYTGNSTTGLVPYNSVEFLYYNPRPSATLAYIPTPSNLTTIGVLLGGVRTKNGTSTVKDYWLSYENGTSGGGWIASGRVRMTKIQECGGGSSTYCLPTTNFEWQEPTVAPQNWSWTGGHGVGSAGWRLVDLFGDGSKVYYTHNGSGTHYATRLKADGTVQNWTWTGGSSTANGGWAVGDIFGDGREVFYTHSSTGGHYATRFNADGTLQNYSWTGGQGIGDSGWEMADIFGDGRQVYYTHNANGQHFATRLNANGTVTNWTWSGGQGVGNGGWRLANLFGDGRKVYYTTSIAATPNSNTQSCSPGMQCFSFNYTSSVLVTHNVTAFKEDGTLENFTYSYNTTPKNGGWSTADIFGDGREVIFIHDAVGGTSMALRVGPSLTQAGQLAVQTFSFPTVPTGDLGWQLVDLLGTGRKIYSTHWSSGRHYAAIHGINSSGGLSQTWDWQSSGVGVGDSGWQMGDLFGDGRQSYYTHSANGTHYVARFSSAAPDLIKKITSGLGATTEISYKPLTDTTAGFYTKDTTSTYPTQDVKAPLYVVYQARQSNGIGGFVTDTYSYTGAKTDLDGRGFLGFRSVVRYNDAMQASFRTDYLQSWPYLGLPALSVNSLASGNLNQVANTFAATSFGGTRYFPYLSQSVNQSWDLNQTPLPTVTSTNQVDAYGNPTQVSVSSSDGFGETTTNTYVNDTVNWFIGRLTRSTVTSTAP